MSSHHSCILQRDSPPSVEFSDERLDSLSESCTSMPVTPNSPSDMYDCDIPTKDNANTLSFQTKNENPTDMTNNVDTDMKDVPNGIVPGSVSFSSATDESTEVPSPISHSKIEVLSNNVLNSSDNSLQCDDVDISKCNQNNDILLSPSDNVVDLETKQKVPESSVTLQEKKSDSKNSRLDSNIPKLISTLTLTDDHPLMMLSSPDSPPSTGNYPDLILPSCKNRDDNRNDSRPSVYENNHLLSSDCSGMMSLSSTEDESFNRSLANGDMNSLHSESFTNPYEPQRNTSKNNLYFSENFIASDGTKGVEEFFTGENVNRCNSTDANRVMNLERNCNIQPDILDSGRIKTIRHSSIINNTNPPDLTVERKKIKPDVRAPKTNDTITKPISGPYKILGRDINPSPVVQKTPSNVIATDKKVSNVEDTPMQTKTNYELPIEMPSDLSATDDIPSPDSSSSRAENERSLYLAEVDPVGGCVTLKPRLSAPATLPTRKRIKPLPNETDTESTVQSDATLFVSCQNKISGSTSSLDSLSDCSLHSDGVDLNQFIAAPSNNSTPRAQSNALMRQISVLKSTDADECSDTETETEGAFRIKISNNDEDDAIPEKIPEYSLNEERQDTRRWLKVTLPSGEKRTIDMKVIEPYKRVLSHGGYALSGRRDAIVVFSACYLPDSSRVDYNYVMDNLFLYVLTTLEQLVTDDYILVYLHGSASKRSMPTFHWLKKCYQLIDRRLRKSLKHLYLVHPTFWLKSIMWMTRPFISTKFSRKLSYVNTLEELEGLVPVEYAAIPEKVRRYDSIRTSSI